MTPIRAAIAGFLTALAPLTVLIGLADPGCVSAVVGPAWALLALVGVGWLIWQALRVAWAWLRRSWVEWWRSRR